MSPQQAFAVFRVDEAQMQALIRETLSQGASWADLFFEKSTYTAATLCDGAVSSGSIHVDYGVGIRALKGERTGYAYCESTRKEDMLRAARTAGAIASRTSGSALDFSAAGVPAGNHYPFSRSWNDVSAAQMVECLGRIESLIREKDSRVTKVMASVSCCESIVMMYNSLGELSADLRPMGSVSASITFRDGRGQETKSVSRSFRRGAEMLCDSLPEEIASEVVKGMDELLEAGRPEGGQMSVVIGAGAGGILLHEAVGHAFEADFIRKGQSIFTGRIGEKVCLEGISIVDDGTFEGNRGACNVDDEGVAGQKTYMVRDGRLESYLHDRISAAYFGVSPTGNGRRESFRNNPIPRMRLTYMENGDSAPEDIIASVKKGVYVDEFSNGQVQIGEGDFTFYVRSGRLIENGRLTAPIKDINIIGNGPEALADIVGVGNDLRIDNSRWICGKDQSVPVGCGMPMVLIKSLTVGGK